MRDNTGLKLIEHYTRHGTLIEQIAGRLFDAKSHKELEESRSIAFELINTHENKIAEVSSNEELSKILPLLSEYLQKKEKFNKLSIKRFLLGEIAKFSDTHRELSRKINEFEELESKHHHPSKKEDSFKDLNLDLLKLFALSHKALLSEILISPEASLSIKGSLKIQEEAAIPEGPEMDRLIRYQTTIQRQLSAAIGELLAIKKMDQSF